MTKKNIKITKLLYLNDDIIAIEGNCTVFNVRPTHSRALKMAQKQGCL